MWLIVVVALAVLALWQYLRARNDIFKRIDVKGPTPTLLFGNMLEVYQKTNFEHMTSAPGEVLEQWTKQYGKVYGFYEGGTPIMVTSDPDMLLEVFVKQFSNFYGRKLMLGQRDPDKSKEVNMFMARGARWKRLRNISNPTFTSMKMKQMYPIISNCIDELIRVLDDKCKKGEAFNIHAVFQGLTLDVIARTAFGYQTSVQSNPNDKLLELCREMLGGRRNLFSRIIVQLLVLFPEMRTFLASFLRLTARLRKHPSVFIIDQMKIVIEERKKQKNANQGVKDFIQLMLEAETSEDYDASEAKTENMENLHIEKKLSANEIVAQCFLFIIAGYETTSTALGFACYLLAVHQDIQEKVYEEIKDTISQVDHVSYETVQKLNYMDMVIHETLRMFPIGQPVLHRRCMKTCTVNGVYIPEGMNIAADVLTLHFNEEHWGSDAQEFNPDRFLPENVKNRHPMVYMPFGAGPRNCIGMRFAMLEAKLALCKVLFKYKIKTCKETQIPIKIEQPSIVRAPKNGVFVMLEERNKQ